jgi:hypothetical protein
MFSVKQNGFAPPDIYEKVKSLYAQFKDKDVKFDTERQPGDDRPDAL